MIKKLFILILFPFLILISTASTSSAEEIQHYPIPVIFDADMSADVDDVTAVRIAQELDMEGYIDIKAFMFCIVGGGYHIKAAEGLFDYVNMTDIPIGTAALDLPDSSPYWGVLANYKTTDHQIYKSIDLYKKILSESPQKVRIITTGYLTNIAELLKDPEGAELVKNKVDCIYMAGGEFGGLCWNFSYSAPTCNAVQYVTTHAQCRLVFVPDILGKIRAGKALQQQDVSRLDPVTKALHEFGTEDGWNCCDGTTAYLAAMDGINTMFNLIPCTSRFQPNGVQFLERTTVSTNIYYAERTISNNDTLYNNTMDRLVEGDFLRKHPVTQISK